MTGLGGGVGGGGGLDGQKVLQPIRPKPTRSSSRDREKEDGHFMGTVCCYCCCFSLFFCLFFLCVFFVCVWGLFLYAPSLKLLLSRCVGPASDFYLK